MKIFLRVSPNADCGVAYYRQWLPLMVAQRQGLCEVQVKHYTHGERQGEGIGAIPVSMEELGNDFNWADLAYFSRNDTPNYLREAVMAQDTFKIPAVVDYDDDVWATRPWNPGYRSFYPNSEYRMWNLEAAKNVYDGITVSTKYLYDKYKKYNPNIYILPNSIDFEERDKWLTHDFSKSDLFKKDKDEIRIGWSGSASHWENLKFIEPAVKEILREFPNTTFYMTGLFGDLFDWKEFGARIKSVPFVNLKEYGKQLRETNLDIALAPLTDCDFNRAKSNLRVLEYSTCKYPVIASPVEPYKEFKNVAILAKEPEDWYQAMKDLIIDKKLRKRLGEDLYTYSKKKYNVKDTCKLWIKSLEEIKKKV